MKHSLTLTIVVTALLAVSRASFAYPSLAGPTGTGVLPSAAVPQAGQLQIAADIYDDQQEGDTALPVRLVYGIGGNMEVGGGFTGADESAWNVNGKINFPSVLAGGVTGAAGARYAEVAAGDYERTAVQFYGLLSKDFHLTGADLRGCLGLDWTDIQFDQPYSDTEDALRPFISLNVSLPNRVNVAFDYQFQNSALENDAMSSIVVRYPINKSFAGELGLTNMDLDGMTGNGGSTLFLGVNYIMDSGK